MRGKAGMPGVWYLSGGITPAYAGKSSGGARADRGWKDHPPRMRGKDDVDQPSLHVWRITPAYAGKS